MSEHKMDRTERVELTTAVMVTDEHGRMLVQNHLDPEWSGLYFPGGHVEPGESFTRAAIREVWEETGLTIRSPRLCGVKQFPIEGGRYIVLFFKSDEYSGTLRDSPEGPVFWCAQDEIKNYRLSDRFLETIDLFQREDRWEMRYVQENGGWKLEIL